MKKTECVCRQSSEGVKMKKNFDLMGKETMGNLNLEFHYLF